MDTRSDDDAQWQPIPSQAEGDRDQPEDDAQWQPMPSQAEGERGIGEGDDEGGG